MGDKYRIKHELVTQKKLRSIQGRPGNQHGRLTSPNSRKQRDDRGLKSSCRAASRLCAGPRGGVGPSQEGCRTQWSRQECRLLLSPPSVALSLEKPLKSNARL